MQCSLRQKEILGLDVPMYNSQAVRFGQRVASLKYVIDRAFDRKRSALEHLPEILANEVLHDHVGSCVRQSTDVVDANGMLGGDLSCQPRLADESLND